MNERSHSHPCRDCGQLTACDGQLDADGICDQFHSGQGDFFCAQDEATRDAAWQKDLDMATERS